MTGVRTVLQAYGRRVAVHLPDAVVEEVLRRLPPAYARTDGTAERMWAATEHGGSWTGQVDGEVLAVGDEPLVLAEALLSDLELWVAEHAEDRVFIHAGCVVVRGRAIVLPGRTMSGKTSLTAALVQAGATYFSDEYAVLDSSGRVQPYARLLSIRPYDGSAPRRVDVADLGGRAGQGCVPVGLVAHLRYQPGGPGLSPLTPGAAALALIDNCVPARTRPVEVLDAVTAAVRGVVAVAGTRGDAQAAAAELLSIAAWSDDVTDER